MLFNNNIENDRHSHIIILRRILLYKFYRSYADRQLKSLVIILIYFCYYENKLSKISQNKFKENKSYTSKANNSELQLL